MERDHKQEQKILEFLIEAEFFPSGKNQYVHEKHGRIFIREHTIEEVVEKLMKLGAVHQTHLIKQSLNIHEDFTFQPTA